MRAEKKLITKEYVERLSASPYFIVTDYTGLSVGQFDELRRRLRAAGAEVHVVKNNLFCIAAKEAGIGELNGALAGQIAVVTGKKDIFSAAKVIKVFSSEFEKPKVHFGFLGKERLDAATLKVYADLPSMEVLRAKIAGVINAPAAALARVLQARVDKGE